MQKSFAVALSTLLWISAATVVRAGESTWVYSVQASAITQASPPQITLSWPADPYGASSYTIHRKTKEATSWGAGVTLSGSATSYVDSDVTAGGSYEYQIVKQATLGYRGYGYIHVGINAPLLDSRGKVILVVDNTHAASLAAELSRLQQDLAGDGWTVIRKDVSRNDTPANVRNLIRAEYNADPANVQSVFLFGRIPVLRSGNLNVDGHESRPMPADVFYGDMDGNWTDANGDGLYDQNTIPSNLELMVGRVDFANMPGNGLGYPGEVELLRRYLNKDHNFRHGILTAPRRGLVGNRFGDFNGQAFAASGYRNFSAFFAAANTITANTDDGAPLADRWVSKLAAQSYLWAYGCGGGSVTSMSGLGTHGAYSDVWSIDLVGQNAKAIFYMMFGSWLGDWDQPDNIMRAALATPDYGLTCSWSGRPHHYYHHMGLGETTGYGIRLSQNNSGLYQNQVNSQSRGVHIALMGDPTLRLHPVLPPSGLAAVQEITGVRLTWLPSSDSNIVGYHVYRATSATGPLTRLTGSPVDVTAFLDTSVLSGSHTYMVRAVKLESAASGTYYNASQGIFQMTGGGSTPALPAVTVTASDATASEPGTDTGAFTISRTGGTTLPLVVNFTVDGSATGGADYQPLATSVTIPSGASSATITVTPLDDPAVEGSETVVLTLGNNTAYNVGSPNSAAVTINDNDSIPPLGLPAVTVVASDATATIGTNDNAAFTFTRIGDTAAALTVNYTLGGTAVKWIDYRRPEGDMPTAITIPAGAASTTMTIVGITNATAANPHTVALALSTDAAYTISSPSNATITIQSAVMAPPPPPPVDTNTVVWVEDALPAGASQGTEGPAWSWVSGNPPPFSGAQALQSGIGTGLHQHYFDWAAATLNVGAGETLVAWVYLDPANLPEEVMLQWNNGNWEHRAYWGANRITYGTDTTVSRRYVGPLPAAGQWARLEVPASQVGLEGSILKGMAFTLFGGRAAFDHAGKSAPASTPPPGPTLPAVTVTASDGTATIGGTDHGEFTFTRTGDTGAALGVNYLLGGSAVKWIDYRRIEGDMPVTVTIPAGAATTTMTIVAVTNATAANPQTLVLTLETNAAYTIGAASSATLAILGGSPASTNPVVLNFGTNRTVVSVLDYTTLELPATNENVLHVLSPSMLELVRINSKQPAPATVDSWDFVDASGVLHAPAAAQFAVTVDGLPVPVQSVGFKRRPFHAPIAQHDLRIASSLYLKLAGSIGDGQVVEVTNPDGTVWPAAMRFAAAADALRYSPAIHVNQEGYVPHWPKKAMVGYYLGSLGEMDVPAMQFHLVDVATGDSVFQGPLAARPDVGYTYTPTPYQKVFAADFSAFHAPGEYRLVVPGLGASLPFLINDGIAMAFARAYGLGLYEQRCGTNNVMPFTRFTHDECHTAPASVPLPQPAFPFTWTTISNYAMITNPDNPAQAAPRLTSPSAQLYPFVRTGPLDATGGHHDAGDYSKYTINSASLVHFLMFSADSLAGVAALDNLGIPESGDGISDILQEAKWEADYLAKIQDSDGGFYFLIYPENREYESNVTPDHGDPQVVWPKTTSATAAAVAALAQCASSPRMKQAYPAAAALYLQRAQLGWQFLTDAIAQHGRPGAYQKITHYGDDFTHNDELVWAACEMFLATGDPAIHQTLKSWLPDPTDPATFRWGWWRLYAGYGNAVRSYAFAARSGRLVAGQVDAAYLAKCEDTIVNAGDDALLWSQQGAYGSSFPDATKRVRGAGWYFSSSQAFDIAVAYQLNAQPAYLDAMIANMNYEGGANPVNVTYVTGLGWKRQREVVDQYSWNDRRTLPKSGIPLGNIQAGFFYTGTYGSELSALTFPSDDAGTAPFPYYDRWADTSNVSTEFVVTDQARSLGTYAFLATLTPLRAQAWVPETAAITGLPAQISTNTVITVSLQLPAGLSLTGARVVWEAQGREPCYGDSLTFTPSGYGDQWVEAEVQWPDGRRVFAMTNLFAENGLPTVTITSADVSMTEGSSDTASFTLTRTGSTASDLPVALQPTGIATKWNDYRRLQGDMPDTFVIPAGSTSATVTVYAADDAEVEGTETATLTIRSDPAYNVGTPYRVTLSLLDNDETPPPADTTPPAVSITAPANSATVSGTSVVVSASASDNVGVTGVQFKLDGANLGVEDTTAPFGMMWNTTTVTAGTHTLTAVARDAAGNQSTAATVTLVVSNAAPAALPTITVTAGDADASRAGLNPGVFTITRTGGTAGALTVHYTLGGTAAGGVDYVSVPLSVTLPIGATSADVTVTPLPSTTLVGSKTVVLTLAGNAAYTVGTTSNATVTLEGNSVPVTSIRATGAGITVTWTSVTGKTYRVAAKQNLGDPAWMDVSGNVPAAGTSTSWRDTDANRSSQRYYVVYVVD